MIVLRLDPIGLVQTLVSALFRRSKLNLAVITYEQDTPYSIFLFIYFLFYVLVVVARSKSPIVLTAFSVSRIHTCCNI